MRLLLAALELDLVERKSFFGACQKNHEILLIAKMSNKTRFFFYLMSLTAIRYYCDLMCAEKDAMSNDVNQ